MTRYFTFSLITAGLLAPYLVACSGDNNDNNDGAGRAPSASEQNADNVKNEGNAGAGLDGGSGGTSFNGVAATSGSGVSSTTGGGLPTPNVGAELDGDQHDGGAAGAAGATNAPDEPFSTNPFVVSAHDPLSTFAADVDTASYDAFRGAVQSGYLPEPQRVRLEEFVNYFDYDYPQAASDAEEPFRIALEAAPNPFADTTILRIGIQGKASPPLERKPTNLVFLVDVSGSMLTATKLPLVQQVLTETVAMLGENDTISIVTYAGDTRVRLPPTSVSNPEPILEEISALSAGGSTAGAAGLTLAYGEAEAGFLEDGLNHIILCTDGDFNVGPSSTTELVELVEEKRRSGVTLTVLGFGASNNDDLMEGISNAGNGMYGNITDSQQASRYVEERMLATLVHIAQDVKLQVEFNPAEVYAYRLLGYENRAIADDDFRDDVVDAGEIGSGHRVTALYELVVNNGAIPAAVDAPLTEDGPAYTGAVEVATEDWALVKVRYKEPGASATDPAKEVALRLSESDLSSSGGVDFRWAVAIAGFAEVLKDSPYAKPEHLDTISELIQDASFADDPDKQDFVTLFGSAREIVGERGF